MATIPDDGMSEKEFVPGELRQLRLEGLPFLMLIQYVCGVALTVVPLALKVEAAGWVGICLALLTLGAVYIYLKDLRLAGLAVVGSLLSAWALSLWLYPADATVWFAVLVVGEASTLFGPRGGFVLGALVSLVIVVAAVAGRLGAGAAWSGSLVVWLDAGLLWLAARPSAQALGWVWISYADARESRDQLRQRQGELNRTLKTLDLAYKRLASLSDELNRARQAAEEARRLKSEFAASISHELRTPLNLIIGFAEMMLMGPRSRTISSLPETFRGDVEAIYRNAGHLSSLVDDILDLSQVEAHRMGLRKEAVALSQVVEEAITAISTMFRDKGLALSARIPDDLPVVQADRVRIRQVLINLLNNAARFTARGGVTIRATYDEHDVVVSVADTGVGIAPEGLATVFDEFHQVGPQGSVRHSGLGLTICKRFVELHGGSIWVESAPGEGSTFLFSLPRAQTVVSAPPERDWGVVSRALAHDSQPPRIAVLGDDAEVLRVFERYLDGCHVVRAPEGKSLRDLARGGVRAAVVTRAAGPGSSLVLPRDGQPVGSFPVISCCLRTAHHTASKLGVTRYLHKPVSRDQVRAALADLGRPIRDVLIADDEPDMVRLLSRMVRAEVRRCRIAEAHDGFQALESLRQRRPDAVLLDLLMPGLDGYEVLERMRGDEELRAVPVVVITAKGAEDETVTVTSMEISRPSGLSVGEAVACLQDCLSHLLARAEGSTSPGRPAAPPA